MSKTTPELRRSRRASGDRRTFEVAFDKQKNEFHRVEDVDYACCYCGVPTRGVGYAYQRSQIACPQHLDDIRGQDAGPPPSPKPKSPKPGGPAPKKRGKQK